MILEEEINKTYIHDCITLIKKQLCLEFHIVENTTIVSSIGLLSHRLLNRKLKKYNLHIMYDRVMNTQDGDVLIYGVKFKE